MPQPTQSQKLIRLAFILLAATLLALVAWVQFAHAQTAPVATKLVNNNGSKVVNVSTPGATNALDVNVVAAGGVILAATTTVQGTVTSTQGTSPWIVAGTVTTTVAFPGSINVAGTVTSTQGTVPWTVTGTVSIAGSSGATTTVTQGTSPWIVSSTPVVISSMPAVTGTVMILNPTTSTVTQGTSPWVTTGTVFAYQGTSPWSVTGTVGIGPWVALWPQSQTSTVTNLVSVTTTAIALSGSVTTTQGTSPWIVSSTPVVVSTMPTVTVTGTVALLGSVTTTQGTSPWSVTGSVFAYQQGAPWSVTGTTSILNWPALWPTVQTSSITGTVSVTTTAIQVSSLPAVTGTVFVAGTVSLTTSTVYQGSPPWLVSSTNPFAVSLTTSTVYLGGPVNQGTSPWVVTGTSFVTGLTFSGGALVVSSTNPGGSGGGVISGTVTSTQGTSPWAVSSTQPLGVIVTNATTTMTQAPGVIWTVSSTAITISNMPAVTGSVFAYQATSPWVVTSTSPLGVVMPSLLFSGGALVVSSTNPGGSSGGVISGTVTSTQGSSPWIVSSTPVVVSTLPAVTGTVFLGGPATVSSTLPLGVVVTNAAPWSVTGSIFAYQAATPWVVTSTLPLGVRDMGLLFSGGALVVSSTNPGGGGAGGSVTQGTSPWVVSSTGPLGVYVVNGGSGGTASNFGAAFPALGTAVGAIDGSGNMANLHVDSGGYLMTTGTASGGGGGGSVTQGTVPWVVSVSGTVTTNGAASASSPTGTPGDSAANPTSTVLGASFNEVWNGASWDRLRGSSSTGLLISQANSSTPFNVGSVTGTITIYGTVAVPSNTAQSLLSAAPVLAGNYGWSSDLSFWRPVRSEGTDNDSEAPIVSGANVPGVLSVESYGKVWNGTTWDRLRGSSSTGVLVSVTGTVTTSGGSGPASSPTGTPADSLSNQTSTVFSTSFNQAWNGTNWDRVLGSSSTGLNAGAWDVVSTGTLAAVNSTVQVALQGRASVSVTFTSSTSMAGVVVVPECSQDGGLTWPGSSSTGLFFETFSGQFTPQLTAPTNTSYQVMGLEEGVSHCRVRIAAGSTGTVVASLRATFMRGNPTFAAAYNNSTGTMPPSVAVIGAADVTTSTYARALAADANNSLRVTLAPAPAAVNSTSTCSGVTTSTRCLVNSGAGLSYYLSNIFLTANGTVSVSVQSTTSTVCTTAPNQPTTVWGSTFLGANGGGPISLLEPIKVNASSTVCCVPSLTSVSSTCILTGRIAP